MLNQRPTTSQIDSKYRNVAEEGRGTYASYRRGGKKAFRRLLYALGALLGIILLMILMFAMKDGHSYLQQCDIIMKNIFGFKPGRVNNNDTLK